MASTSSITESQNLETFTLIWLDSLVHTSQDNIDTKKLLRKAINRVKTFQDSDRCIEYIRSLTQQRIVLIVSGRLGQITVPAIHHLPQLIAIYVYCSDKKRNEDWPKKYIKVKDVIVDLPELIRKIQTDQTKREEYKIDEPLPITIFHTNPHYQASDNDDFIYFQLLIDCLSRMKPKAREKERLIALCKENYQGNEEGLNVVYDFEKTYSSDRAIWWFTKESFACRMVNKAFLSLNTELLYYFHFLIHDIEQQLRKNKNSSKLRTYRAQLMTTQELDVLRDAIQDIISINTFLQTIPNYERAMEILNDADASDELHRVLIEIDANSHAQDFKPFCDISLLEYFTGVKITLFMAGSLFHLIDIREENNITFIQLSMCSDTTKELKDIIEDKKSECYLPEPNLLSFATILTKMKRFDGAKFYYEKILEDMPNDHLSNARCYRGLANIAMEQDNYDLSIKLHRKALDIEQTVLRPGDPEIASEYSTLAEAYIRNNLFYDAHEAYNEALRIWMRTLGKDHPKVAICLKNIASAFELEQKYDEAIVCYEKTLVIYAKILPQDHHDRGNIHNYIGHAYAASGDTKQGFKHFDIAKQILKKSHSTTNFDMIALLKNMSDAHETLGNHAEALEEIEKVLSLQRQILPANDPELIHTESEIKRLSTLVKPKKT